MIDWDRLNTLRDDIGDEDFAEVAEVFVAEIGEHLERLTSAPDTAGADDFHFLRGSAVNLGFADLARACEAAEATCAAGDRPEIDRIAHLFHASVAEMTAHHPDLANVA